MRLGANRYYITGRQSSTSFSIQNSAANGGTPGSTAITFGSSSITIYRAFNSLSQAVSNASNAGHLNTSSLVAGGYQLNIACYADGTDTTPVAVSGWTTDATHFFRIFTPCLTNEVGRTQRHAGKFDAAAYTLRVSNAAAISVSDAAVRVEGLQIYVDATDGFDDSGLLFTGSAGSADDYRVSQCIIRGPGDSSNDWCSGVSLYLSGAGAIRIWNNIVYDWGSNAENHGLELSDGDYAAFVYNNTFHSIAGAGIRSAIGVKAINDITQSGGCASST